MKKLLTMMLLLVSLTAQAQDIDLFTGDCYLYNEMLDGSQLQELKLQYSIEDGYYYYIIESEKIMLSLTGEHNETFIANCEKYLEWCDIANSKNITIQKDIPDLTIENCGLVFDWCNEFYVSKTCFVYFKFFSIKEQDHYLTLHTNKAVSYNNDYIDCQIKGLYLPLKTVNGIMEGMATREAKIIEFEALENNDDLFK